MSLITYIKLYYNYTINNTKCVQLVIHIQQSISLPKLTDSRIYEDVDQVNQIRSDVSGHPEAKELVGLGIVEHKYDAHVRIVEEDDVDEEGPVVVRFSRRIDAFCGHMAKKTSRTMKVASRDLRTQLKLGLGYLGLPRGDR